MDKKFYGRRSDLVSAAVVAGNLLVVFGPIYACAVAGPGLHLLVLWLYVGLSMPSVLHLMHECAHFLVFVRKGPCVTLGRYVLGPLAFADFDAYRNRHLDHHRYLGVEGETKDAYLVDIGGKNLISLLIRCLLLVEGCRKFSNQVNGTTVYPAASSSRWLIRVAVLQLTFLGTLVLAAYAFGTRGFSQACISAAAAYCVAYAYALASLTVFMATLRAVAEHQITGDGAAEEGYACLRNFQCNGLTRFLMGSYGFGEHHTHHKVPGVPYYHLIPATQALVEAGEGMRPYRGYFATVWAIFTRKQAGDEQRRIPVDASGFESKAW